ncbi:hypothetical protein ACGFZQ_12415 [Streptomyces sp. NPDC048254]|uniref:hypothetical protein n=1 Tax=Streptomyces sp. NPDC048254 TaxID=3365525 RepID=UPI00371E7E5B
MVSVTRSTHDIEVTAEGLQEELARLQIQKQALERELAAVVAHLGSVRRALSAFESLMRAPAVAEQVQVPKPVVPQAEIASTESAKPAKPAGLATTPAPRAQQPPSRSEDADRPAPAGDDTDGQHKYGRLTEQIMEYFAAADDVDVRARDVAAALGRDSDSGSINGVRSTLDRLVGASRIQRTGRGLYRARRS